MKIIERAKHLAWQKLGDNTIILDSRINKEVHELNVVASFLWEQCNGTNSEDDLVQILCSEFEVDQVTSKGDVREFLDELQSKSLLTK